MAGGATCPHLARTNRANHTRPTVNLKVENLGGVVALERYRAALTARSSGYRTWVAQ
jgi:hypothetical protein